MRALTLGALLLLHAGLLYTPLDPPTRPRAEAVIQARLLEGPSRWELERPSITLASLRPLEVTIDLPPPAEVSLPVTHSAGVELPVNLSTFRPCEANRPGCLVAIDRAVGSITTAPEADPQHPNSPADMFYPPDAQLERVQGTAEIAVFVRTNGSVGPVRLIHSSGSARLDAAAISYVSTWHLLPGRRNGVVEAMWAAFEVSFRPHASSVTALATAGPGSG
jgi:TonB family protein